MAKALTTKGIEALKPPKTRIEIADTGVTGLYLIHQPTGSKGWALRCRINGKPVKMTLGSWPKMGLADARGAAAEMREKIEQGGDPVAERKAVATAAVQAEQPDRDTVKEVIKEFTKRHLKHTRSADQVTAFFRREVIGPWGDRDIRSITRRDCIELLDGVVDRGSPVSANRLRAHLNTLLNWAIGRDIIDRNPMDGVRPPAPESSRDRVLTEQEIGWLWAAAGKMGYPFGDVVRLLLLTGARLREVAEATRGELSEGGKVWTLPGSRSKNGDALVLPLSAEAAAIFAAAPQIAKARHIFTTTGTSPISGFTRARDRLVRLMVEAANKDRPEGEESVVIAPFTLHDLRRSFATGVASLRIPPHVVESLLNHKSGSRRGVAGIYNRFDHNDEKREALAAWANRVIEIVNGPTQNVVALRAGGR